MHGGSEQSDMLLSLEHRIETRIVEYDDEPVGGAIRRELSLYVGNRHRPIANPGNELVEGLRQFVAIARGAVP